ncbi:IS5 family transposase [Streptomyces griseochromogenes]|uniref:IS5 family transposase n=1 Tax=Streptomyces griseochromogenes TaxID=68214 RepID=A0ABS4LKQ6_9ACTN|nr:IS5 family transposase [Streptomyces griseochromogenes]
MRDRLRQRPRGQRGTLTGPNQTERGKSGSKIHLIVDRNGLPLSIGISGANLHDNQALEPLVRGIPPIRSRRRPRRRRPTKLHGDKGYDYSHLRRWLRTRGIIPRSDTHLLPQTAQMKWTARRSGPCRLAQRERSHRPPGIHWFAAPSLA